MLGVYKSYWIRIIDFKGRSTRKEFWIPMLINYLTGLLVFAVLQVVTNNTFAVTNVYSVGQLVLVVSYEFVVVSVWLASFSLRIRRLHDIGLTGRWILVYFIPVIGMILYIIMALWPSSKQSKYNCYGEFKTKSMIISLVVVLIMTFLVIFLKNYANYALEAYRSDQVAKWGADQTPLMSKEDFELLLDRYRQTNKTSNLKSISSVRQIIIPGLHGAWSLNHRTKQVDFGDDWVPQGLAETDKYYFISAYDGEHRLNSLIFMVNKKTGKYYKSIILKRKAHVGGLAIDRQHQLLWVSNDVKNHAKVEGLSLKTIAHYSAEQLKKPIQAEQNAPLYWASKTSGLAYFNNNLMIVKYGTNSKSHSVVDMELNPKSGLVLQQSQRKINWTKFTEAYRIGGIKGINDLLIKQGYFRSLTSGYDRMQGLAVLPAGRNQVNLIYTQSNGDQASDLIVSQTNFEHYFDFKTAVRNHQRTQKLVYIKIPPSAEQLTADPKNKTVSILFEGGAKEYRKYKFGFVRDPFMDRLVVYKFSH